LLRWRNAGIIDATISSGGHREVIVTRHRSTTLLRIALLTLVLVQAAGCARDRAEPTARGLLIIGIDSADWSLLDPMIDQGRLPNLAAFRGQSASGRMESLMPLEKSPVLWATISTGMTPDRHGIGGFVKGDEQEIVGAADWRAAALWDIAGASGLTTTVLGMWSTHPARPIAGIMVSDFLSYSHGRDRIAAGLVQPDSLTAGVREHAVDPEQLDWSVLARFLPDGTLEEAVRDYPREMNNLREIYAADLSFFEVARWLTAEHPTDILYFYQRGPDMISHRFWRYMEPEKTPSRMVVPERMIEIFGDVVPRYYDFTDELLGELLSWFPPDHPTVVLSDHGFQGPDPSGQTGTHEHDRWGIFLVRSPLYEAGVRFDSIHIYDICPTFLALIGLPASSEMPGRVLPDALTPLGRSVVTHVEAHRIPSYQALCPVDVAAGETDPEVSEEIRRQLRSLGYIQ
jgi:predicted AlkP superfamily phosphohydrolase/phosphomutase